MKNMNNKNYEKSISYESIHGEKSKKNKRRTNCKSKKRVSVAAKTLVIGAAALVSIILLTANCLAAEISETEDGAISYAEGPTNVAPETRTQDTKAEGQNTGEAMADTTVDGASEKTADDSDAEKDTMTAAVDALHEHLGEILSALTLIGSLAIAFTYKKGLLPLLSGALGRLGDASGAAKASAESAAQTAEQIHSTVQNATAETARICGELTDGMNGMAQRLTQIETQLAQSRRADSATEATVELLYDIFMSSSLPNYRKEEVSARLKNIMAALTGSDASSFGGSTITMEIGATEGAKEKAHEESHESRSNIA